MTNFVKPKPRFDRALANAGVWYYPEDEVGNDYGGFLCGLYSDSIPRVKIIQERAKRAVSARSRGKREETSVDENIAMGIENFVDACLIDWDMKDEDGKEIKFSKAKAIEFFLQHEIDPDTGEKMYVYDFVFGKLFDGVRDVRNYQSDEQLDAGDPLGN